MHPRTTPLPPVELTDPLWTIEHLARALRLGERATRTAITDPTFPSPFRLSASPTARLYWVREHLLAHFAARATAPSTAAPRAAEAPAAPAASPAPTRPPRLRPAAAPGHPAPSLPTPAPASDPAAAAWAAIDALPTTGRRAR